MLNEKGQRELAYIVAIDEIQPIEGADRVEIAIVGGWKVMVQKGQFKAGDLAVYFEIDSKVPANEAFAFLESKHYKIKTQKYFKGTVISQGLLMAAGDLSWDVKLDQAQRMVSIGGHKKGDFVTAELGVTYEDPEDNIRKAPSIDKYKKMEKRHPKLFRRPFIKWIYKYSWGKKLLFFFLGKKADDKADWPYWVSKTDEERIQNMPYILADKSEWIATEKIDGTSTTFTMKRMPNRKNQFFVCSRNVCFDTSAKKNVTTYYGSNVYQEMATKYKAEEVLADLLQKKYPDAEWITLQGETFGAEIQKRDYGKKEHDFRGFNLFISNKGRLNPVDSAEIMKEYDIPWVPIVDEHFILPDTVDELLAIATGKSVIDGGMREGLVFRSKDGARSFKAVSNEFLLKYHA